MKTLYRRLADYRAAIAAPWFEKPYDLNLLFGRSENVGFWDDLGFVAYLDDDGAECVHSFACTTEASVAEFRNPTNRAGCIWIVDGHYPGAYERGQHNGRIALEQVGLMAYVRWTGRSLPQMAALRALAATDARFTANRATNCHDRVSARTPAVPGDGDSAGCPVALVKAEYRKVLDLNLAQLTRYGSSRMSPTFAPMRDLIPV